MPGGDDGDGAAGWCRGRIGALRAPPGGRLREGPGRGAPHRPPGRPLDSPLRGGRPAWLGRLERAIPWPDPALPEELRRLYLGAARVLRFAVAPGSARAEIAVPGPGPRLDAAVLGGVRGWRWFPALEGGRPVAATVEVRLLIR
ncbi:energy transducer TonB [Roseomonas sp. NAR14]|uniref:Energy transducer TonB n=1 Tax=Roseomonas acroporae TaxID=2937791 RepID=A0A9X2BYA8_9PROT|nr:energy transducer TonB [Roseomonas acroporae]MCK8786779.1 energy transducer TonB [Roseomonas acroporae]